MRFLSLMMAAFFSIMVMSCNSQNNTSGNQTVSLETEIDSVSYSLGLNIAQNVKTQGLEELNYDALIKAFKDVYEGNEPLLEEADASTCLNTYFQGVALKKSEAGKAEGVKFLAENGTREGVITTESGLQYEIITEGTGSKPGPEDNVTTHYHGTLIDGTVFDSSVERGEPVSFPVNGVIQGWTEALQLMPVGSKWKLYIPSELAYGERGAGSVIAPNQALIFEVELLSID